MSVTLRQIALGEKCPTCGAQIFTRCYLTSHPVNAKRRQEPHEARIHLAIENSVKAELQQFERSRGTRS